MFYLAPTQLVHKLVSRSVQRELVDPNKQHALDGAHLQTQGKHLVLGKRDITGPIKCGMLGNTCIRRFGVDDYYPSTGSF